VRGFPSVGVVVAARNAGAFIAAALSSVIDGVVRRTSLSGDLVTYRRELLAVTRSHGEYRRPGISV
jgi:hypothetical protein